MKGKMFTALGPDTILPEHDTLRRSQPLEPEKALLLAILQDAIHTYRKYLSAGDAAGKERFEEAKTWISQAGNDWIFSFDNVCELLGLDPEYLRRGLLEWQKQNAAQSKRQKRHGLQGGAV